MLILAQLLLVVHRKKKLTMSTFAEWLLAPESDSLMKKVDEAKSSRGDMAQFTRATFVLVGRNI